MPTRARPLLARLALVASSLVIALLLGELLARWVRPMAPYAPPLYAFDPVLGWREKPGIQIEVRNADGRVIPIRVNRASFRGPERELRKQPGTTRIVVFGDSFTEAIQVREEESFPFLLETLLNEDGRGRFEVFGLGVSSYGTVHQLLRLRRDVHELAPDVVVFQVCVNDFWDNLRSLSYQRRGPWAEEDPDDPSGVRLLPVSYEKEPALPAPMAAWRKPFSWLKWNSALAQALAAAVQAGPPRAPESAPAAQAPDAEPPEPAAAPVPQASDVVNPLVDPRSLIARRVLSSLLRLADDEARTAGSAFVAYFNPSTHIDTGATIYEANGRTERFLLDAAVEEWLIRDVLRDCEAHGVRCVWSRELFAPDFASGSAVTAPNDPHWNARGHRLVAEDLSRVVNAVLALHDGAR